MQRNPFLDDLRAVAICMVVMIHALAYSQWHPAWLEFIVSTIAVPSFFTVDGFIFASKANNQISFSYLEYINKSAKRLLIPWIIFNVFYLIARIGCEQFGILGKTLTLSFENVLVYLYTTPHAPHLFFLPALFAIRCLSFATIKLLVWPRSYICIGFCLFAILYVLFKSELRFDLIQDGLEPLQHAIWGFQFYLFGIVLFNYIDILKPHSLPISLILFIGSISLKFSVFDLAIIPQYMYLLSAFLLFVNISKARTALSALGALTMGIYLTHTPIVIFLIFSLFKHYIRNEVLVYWLSVLCALFTSLGITILISNYLPYGNVIFGEYHDSHRKRTG